MHLSLRSTRLGLRNSVTRIPFRYGQACLTACPQAILQATIEVAGRTQHGYSGDCLPPSWFDKTAGKSYQQQTTEMLDSIELAEGHYRDAFRQDSVFFAAWQNAYRSVQEEGERRGYPALLSSFGSSMLERAILDAMCRAAKSPFGTAIRGNMFGLKAGEIHAELAGLAPDEWLPDSAVEKVFVRHTVGLSDPLTATDLEPADRLADGMPQTLEQYIARSGLRYFKIKVCNQHDRDLDRLRAIAEMIEQQRGTDYRLTIDGNEQYKLATEFGMLLDSIQADPKLHTLWQNVIAIEQPLERSVALNEEHTRGIRELATAKPVIIDESDGELSSYPRAIEVGYRGVSSKSCKGVIKSILNAGLTWFHNDRGRQSQFLMTAEDLCTVGVVPVQADLCLVATLGLEHVERNGHHYHPGLSYLGEKTQQAALAAHPDFYEQAQQFVSPRLTAGQFDIRSLQCNGFGFAVEPDMDSMQPRGEWSFDSLGVQ